MTLTEPAMDATHYGIPVCHIGEYGEMLALGHHDKRRALAAFNRHARVYFGSRNLADDRSAAVDDYLRMVTHTRAVFQAPDPDQGDDPSCPWYADCSDPDAPDAQPVTLLIGM